MKWSNFTDSGPTAAFSSPRWAEISSGVWLAVILVFGTTLDLAVLITIFKHRQLITPYNILIIAILLNDLVLCLISPIFAMISEFAGGWYVYFDEVTCDVNAFMVFFCGLSSLYLLAGVSFNRYLVMTRSNWTQRTSKTFSVLTVVFCQFLGLFFSSAPFFGWSSYGLEAHGTSCGLDWRNTGRKHKYYIAVIAIFCFALPLAFMVFCYTSIYVIVKKSTIAPQSQGRVDRQRLKERKLLKMSIMFVAAFCFAWTPYAIVSFYTTYGNVHNIHPILTRSCAFLAKSEAIINPVIYVLATGEVRKKLVAMVPCNMLRYCCKEGTTEVMADARDATNPIPTVHQSTPI